MSELAREFDSTVLALLEYNNLPDEETLYQDLDTSHTVWTATAARNPAPRAIVCHPLCSQSQPPTVLGATGRPRTAFVDM